MKIRIYTIKKEFLCECNSRNVFEDSFYHKPMPALSQRKCSGILDSISPHFKIEKEFLLFEDVMTGHIGCQYLYRKGTILNF